MPTKSLQLDGPNLEDLLEQALAEAGPHGRVVSADRIRRGGVGGFFAREHYEVLVEVPDDAPPARTATAAPKKQPRAATPVKEPVPDAPKKQPASTAVPKPAAAAAPQPENWYELADNTEDVLEISGGGSANPAPSHGTAGGTPSAPGGAAPRPATSQPDAPSASASNTPSTDLANMTVPMAGTAAAVPSTERSSFASVLAGVARDALFDAGSNVARESSLSLAPGADPVPESPIAPAPGRRTGAWVEAAHNEAVTVAAELFPETPAAHGRIGSGLVALGLPQSLLPDATVLGGLESLAGTDDIGAYTELALARALQYLPAAPELPAKNDSLLFLVGDLTQALEFSLDVAEDTCLEPGDVLVASQARDRRGVTSGLRAISLEEANSIRSDCRRATCPTVVVMHAPVSAQPDPWARRMLDSYQPTAVWGIVSATQKSEDIAAWAGWLGGLDAIAVEDAAATVSPGRVLSAGIPVAALDGRRATPALWAALLAGRLLLDRVHSGSATAARRG